MKQTFVTILQVRTPFVMMLACTLYAMFPAVHLMLACTCTLHSDDGIVCVCGGGGEGGGVCCGGSAPLATGVVLTWSNLLVE